MEKQAGNNHLKKQGNALSEQRDVNPQTVNKGALCLTWLSSAPPVITGSWSTVSCRLGDALRKTCLNPSHCSSAGLPFLCWPQCVSEFTIVFPQDTQSQEHEFCPASHALILFFLQLESMCQNNLLLGIIINNIIKKVQHLLLLCVTSVLDIKDTHSIGAFAEWMMAHREFALNHNPPPPLLHLRTEDALHSPKLRRHCEAYLIQSLRKTLASYQFLTPVESWGSIRKKKASL